MAKEEMIKMRGRVQETERTGFRVQLEGQEAVVFCTISGKLRKNHIRIIAGDYIDIELSPYDLEKGRITYRHNRKPEDYK